MTRLDVLIKLHNNQGGTIHQFNRTYQLDFISMSEACFINFIYNFNPKPLSE